MHKSALKAQVRSAVLEKRRRLAFEEVWRLSVRVQRRLLDTGYFQGAGRISLYASFDNEVVTDGVFDEAIEAGKEVFYPRVTTRGGERHLAFHRVASLGELSPGAYDVPEPGGVEAAEPGAFDLVVVPGVAFDRAGNRIGYGKGYYDKALKMLGCPIVGLAYAFQLVDEIPAEDHDVKLSALVTEEEVFSWDGV